MTSVGITSATLKMKRYANIAGNVISLNLRVFLMHMWRCNSMPAPPFLSQRASPADAEHVIEGPSFRV